MPAKSTVLNWACSRKDELKEFRDRWARALIAAGHSVADKVQHVADQTTPETAHADRVKIEAYRWIAARREPKVYGDRTDLHVSGELAVRPVRDSAPEWLTTRLVEEAALAAPQQDKSEDGAPKMLDLADGADGPDSPSD